MKPTLRTNNVSEAIDRVIEAFPSASVMTCCPVFLLRTTAKDTGVKPSDATALICFDSWRLGTLDLDEAADSTFRLAGRC